VLSVESHGAIIIRIHLVHQGVGILGETRCENHTFEVLGHCFQELVHTGPLRNVNVANVAIYVYWDYVVGVLYLIELGVDQSFVQVKD